MHATAAELSPEKTLQRLTAAPLTPQDMQQRTSWQQVLQINARFRRLAKPVSILVDTFGTGKIEDEKIAQLVEKNFDLRPAAIIRDLDLRRPIYRQTAAYGHFGRTDIDLPWEHTDKAEALREQAGL